MAVPNNGMKHLKSGASVKLSEAILKGCQGTEQEFGHYGDRNKCCALGAANLASFGSVHGASIYSSKVVTSQHFEDVELDCPECGGSCSGEGFDNVLEGVEIGTVSHLNDTHRWSREKIANWLKDQGL